MTIMDRELPLFPSLLIIACLLLGIGQYMYRVPEFTSALIGQLIEDYDGNLWTLHRNRLIVVKSATTIDPATLSLESYNVQNHVGQLIALRGGGWIINVGGQTTSLLHKISRFLRIVENPSTGQSTLLKCDRFLSSCSAWGDPALSFHTAWSGLELSNGNFVINDTARHKVHYVSLSGSIINTLTSYEFPNHVIEKGQQVWVTDTNNNRLVSHIRNQNSLKKTEQTIGLLEFKNINKSHRFPSVSRYTEGRWWALSNDHTMANAGIYRLDNKTAYRYAESLEDPTDFIIYKNQLFVANYDKDIDQVSIWQQNLSNRQLKQTILPELKRSLEAEKVSIKEAKKKLYINFSILGLIAFLSLFFALRASKPVSEKTKFSLFSKEKSSIDFDADIDSVEHQPTQEIWIKKNSASTKKLRQLQSLLLIITIITPLLIGLSMWLLSSKATAELNTNVHTILLINGGLLLVIDIWILFILKRNLNIRIGVFNHQFRISTEPSEIVDVDPKTIKYSKHGIFAGGLYVPVQNQQLTIYDKESFEHHALPLLREGKKLSIFKLYLCRISNGETQSLVDIIFITAAAMSIIYIKLNLGAIS